MTAYQERLVATCDQVHRILTADHSSEIIVLSNGRLTAPPTGSAAHIDKAGLLSAYNGQFDQVHIALSQLGRQRPPAELATRKRAVDAAYKRWAASFRRLVRLSDQRIRDGMDPLELQRINGPLSAASGIDPAGAQLNAALSDLAGRTCTATA